MVLRTAESCLWVMDGGVCLVTNDPMLPRSASVRGRKCVLLIHRPTSVQFKFTWDVICSTMYRKITVIEGFEKLFNRLKCYPEKQALIFFSLVYVPPSCAETS